MSLINLGNMDSTGANAAARFGSGTIANIVKANSPFTHTAPTVGDSALEGVTSKMACLCVTPVVSTGTTASCSRDLELPTNFDSFSTSNAFFGVDFATGKKEGKGKNRKGPRRSRAPDKKKAQPLFLSSPPPSSRSNAVGSTASVIQVFQGIPPTSENVFEVSSKLGKESECPDAKAYTELRTLAILKLNANEQKLGSRWQEKHDRKLAASLGISLEHVHVLRDCLPTEKAPSPWGAGEAPRFYESGKTLGLLVPQRKKLRKRKIQTKPMPAQKAPSLPTIDE